MSEDNNLVLGLFGVTVALFGWGSFTLPMKAKEVAAANLDSMVFNMYMGIGVALSSLPILIFLPWNFTWWSTAGAALFAPGCLFCVLTVEWIGIAKGQAIWAGCVALQSFLCGFFYFGETPQNLLLTLVGGAILLAGIGTLSFVEVSPPEEGENVPLKGAADAEGGAGYAQMDHPKTTAKEVQPIKGLFGCVMIGLLCGSCMVPFRLAPAVPFQNGIDSAIYAVGFGLSLMVINMMVLAIRAAVSDMPELHNKLVLFLASFLGSANGQNHHIDNHEGQEHSGMLVILVTFLPAFHHWAFPLATPLTQCCLLVAGIWGITVFNEIRGAKAISTFFAGAAVVLVGAVLLGIYGQSAPAEVPV
eukprot:CAMPEP_0114533628 /NCGR_PEP_ID=MMETSP0109-20121206/27358_1 /TAXON_ID=29199 /ORGANISM="Chlorarachnion reptans, Strain CCCM449" /LENGTH=359 /DNA_ID=CAMNT_0001716887 /DNA_START=96 /DNA_END=1175 /DNA_ORIENTATION=+